MCSPSGVTKQLVLANLLSELLFARGDKCHSVDSLPQLYQDHFKAPLPLRTFNVKDLTSLMKLPKVAEAINLVDISVRNCIGSFSFPCASFSLLSFPPCLFPFHRGGGGALWG